MRPLLAPALGFLRALAIPRATLVVENAARRQQLAVYQRATNRPTLRPGDRLFWVVLRGLWAEWHRPLVFVQPGTVIGWHRRGVRALWRRTSRPGRPRIPHRHIVFIRRISTHHPEWGEDRIAEELAAKCGIRHSGSTIRRYMVLQPPRPRGDQTLRMFVRNHAAELWACNFLTQVTATFSVAYVFVVMEIASRRIVHTNVTTNPTLPWVKQQLCEATAWGEGPRFLLHDNDGIFGQYRPPRLVTPDGPTRRHRCPLDRWLHEVMNIQGIPIPYGAPNASPHAERFNRPLREEALDHLVLLSVAHIRRVVTAYVRYYNGARPSQGIHRIPAPYPELREPPPADGALVALPVLGALHHDYRLAA